MVSSLANAEASHSEQAFKTLLRHRSRPSVIVFDADARVAFAERHALTVLDTRCPRLIDQVSNIIRNARESDSLSEQLLGLVGGLVVRIVPLSGTGGSFYAVFFEEEARREDLREAVTRFSFTPREVQILDRILDGMNAAEIAEDLHIAEVTVFDHFKHISYKTKARNRADMLAKIFNWQPDLKAKCPEVYGTDRRVGCRERSSL